MFISAPLKYFFQHFYVRSTENWTWTCSDQHTSILLKKDNNVMNL